MLSVIKSNYDPTDSNVQKCQIGLTNTTVFKTKIESYKSISINQYVLSISGKKKRSISSLACSDLINIGTQVTSLTTTQLNMISVTDFYDCQTFLGSMTSWSSSQLTVLASLAKSVKFLTFSIHLYFKQYF